MFNLLDTTIKAAIKGGEAIMAIYEDPKSDFQIEHKSDNSPLTIADKKSNQVILDYLSSTSIPILSEECKHAPYETRKEWTRLWIVDPLDGTKEFIKRNGEFTVNIALVENGTPIMGVIYVPVKKILYFGSVEIGSFKVENVDCSHILSTDAYIESGKKLPIANANTGKAIKVVASRSHLSEETIAYIDKLKEKNHDVELVSIGSSLKICLVAEGSAAIYPRFAPTMEWDTAAGHAIVKSAGKNIYLIDEKTPLHYNKSDLLNPWFIVK